MKKALEGTGIVLNLHIAERSKLQYSAKPTGVSKA